MSTIMAVEANGALSSALQGLRGAGRQVSSVSEEISNINTKTLVQTATTKSSACLNNCGMR